jgi:hypothetical protein
MEKFESTLKENRRKLEVTVKLGDLEDALVKYFNDTRVKSLTTYMDLVNIIHAIINIDSIKKVIDDNFPTNEKTETEKNETEFMKFLFKTLIDIMEEQK